MKFTKKNLFSKFFAIFDYFHKYLVYDQYLMKNFQIFKFINVSSQSLPVWADQYRGYLETL
jgi:hypothetical protein